jgi:hypothetical protein
VTVPFLQPPVTRWECGHCNARDTTRQAGPHTRFHPCAGLGIVAPMVPEGSGARTVAKEREDYIGSEQVQTNAAGRPIMSVSTERPDGSNDLVVFAPTARAGSGA